MKTRDVKQKKEFKSKQQHEKSFSSALPDSFEKETVAAARKPSGNERKIKSQPLGNYNRDSIY